MSLINEALQRARDEATRREAARKGLPLAPIMRARPASPLLMLVVLVLAAALTISLLVLVRTAGSTAGRQPGEPAREGTTPVAAPQAPSPEPHPTQEARSQSDPGSTEAMVPDQVTEPGRNSAAAPSPASTPSAADKGLQTDSSSSAGVADRSAPAKTQPGRSDPRFGSKPAGGETSVEAPRVFVRVASLADGTTIDLGGIAWSETGPFALLNGKVVGIGESIEGYLVTEITPTEVSCEKFGDRIVLRLK